MIQQRKTRLYPEKKNREQGVAVLVILPHHTMATAKEKEN